ncbi:MAG: cell division protein FtsQ/DivIB [Actinobacteria bacterium]|nr:cell division protein FtsQ/DivIB [Actinomycetota bacterium]
MATEAPVLRPVEQDPPGTQRPTGRRLRIAKGAVIGWSVVCVLLVVAAAWLLSWYSPVPVRELTVVGASEETEQEIRARVDVRLGEAISAHDPGAMEASVRELPGVVAADVQLSRPWTILIAVDERFPFAQFKQGDQYAIVDETGEVIRTAAEPMKRLPELGSDAEQAPMLDALRAAPEDLIGRIAGVGVNEGQVVLLIRNGGLVQLGSTADLEAKYNNLRALLRTKADAYNLSVPERPALIGDLTLPKRNRVEQQGDSTGIE